MSTFLELQANIKKALNQDVQAKKLQFMDLMAIMWILGQAKDEAELRAVIEIYKSDYSALNDVLEKEKSMQTEAKEQDLQLIISAFLQDDPIKATELLKFMSKNKNAEIAEISEQFPEIKKYLA